MGRRQLDADTRGAGDFKLDFVQLTDRSNPDFIYGALARDGISCAVCHRTIPDQDASRRPAARTFPRDVDHGRFRWRRPTRSSVPTGTPRSLRTPCATPSGSRRASTRTSSRRACAELSHHRPAGGGRGAGPALARAGDLSRMAQQRVPERIRPSRAQARTCRTVTCPATTTARTRGSGSLGSARRSPSWRIRTTRKPSTSAPGSIGIAPQGVQAPRVPGPERLPAGDVPPVQRHSRGAHERLHERLEHRPRGRHRQRGPAGQERTATIRVSARAAGPESLEAEVAMTNLAGHRFPSGVGFRRAFIELLVFEDGRGAGRSSGRRAARTHWA